ncbi:hypothetical protein SDC9_27439 [bioreactor metagenome]|uniref:Uncharacterized protein n=1 Tax=bioreactor metagenome TaxID=1076179 RepID=A0A644URI8_9ZZZZ
MEKIIQGLSEWPFLTELPQECCGFIFEKQLKESDDKYLIFRYYNEEWKRSFTVLYDGATKEFLARIVVGLTEFCDICYIVGSLEQLEKVLQERLESTLSDLATFNIKHIDCILREKMVIEWPFAQQLPKKVGEFSLFISPSAPVKAINGSYIIIDYCDFASESNLIIYYNIFRDEFFGEIKIRRTPLMTAEFDAKMLNELEEKITEKLVETLESIGNMESI